MDTFFCFLTIAGSFYIAPKNKVLSGLSDELTQVRTNVSANDKMEKTPDKKCRILAERRNT